MALQNLQALEVLLFGVDLLVQTPKATYACALAAAIGRRQGELAAEVLADWQGDEGFNAAFTSTAGTGEAPWTADRDDDRKPGDLPSRPFKHRAGQNRSGHGAG